MINKKICDLMKDKIYHKYETEEPSSCEYNNCDDKLNGLHHCWIYISDFCFDTWLCHKHFEKFRREHKMIMLNGGNMKKIK